jgi:amidase
MLSKPSLKKRNQIMGHPNYPRIGFVVLLTIFVGGCMNERSPEPRSQRFQFVETTIAKSQSAILAGKISCRELVNGYLQRIEMLDKSSGINAITQVNANATEVADAIDQSIAAGEVQPDLFCVPVLVKDNYDTYDMVTTGGSIALKNSVPSDDAFMIKRLRNAGAIILAKTNMAEWAFSPRESVSSSYGRTANAYDIGFVPAGSSGGTASGVAASLGLVGMGSDTGNSIRGPSSHLALFGIRSTIGLTSRDGIIPLVFDRDIAGPMTRTVEDGVRIFNVVAGFDPADSLTVPDKRETDYRDFLNLDGLQGKRIGVFRALVDHEDADPEIKALFHHALIDLTAAGATIIDPVEILDFEVISEQIPFCGRFRYDIGQYFKTLPNPPLLDVNDVLASGDYAPETKSSLEYFSQFPLDVSPDDWDEECDTWPDNSLRNQLLTNAILAMEQDDLDALVYPSWSNPPARIDEADEGYKGDNNQMLVPDAGLPAVTVAMGFWDGRLPTGLQFAGRPYSEGVLIELAYAYEQFVTHRRAPAGFEELD